MTTQRFSAAVTRAGGKTFIVIPFAPDTVWGAKERHHITGTIDGASVRGPLAVQGDAIVLPLGPAWLRDNGIAPGMQVAVELAPEGPQTQDLPADLSDALAREPEALVFFESLATFYRTGYLRWLAGARRPEAREVRIGELVALLKAGRKQR